MKVFAVLGWSWQGERAMLGEVRQRFQICPKEGRELIHCLYIFFCFGPHILGSGTQLKFLYIGCYFIAISDLSK
jgi:hypothetical protein